MQTYVSKKTAIKILFAFAAFYASLFVVCNAANAQSGSVVQMNYSVGVITAKILDENKIAIVYTPSTEHTDPDSITVNTYRFCPEKWDIVERFGSTVWLSAAGDMKYSDFLQKYMLENNPDGIALYEHAKKLRDGFDRHFPATIVKEMRNSIRIKNRKINMD